MWCITHHSFHCTLCMIPLLISNCLFGRSLAFFLLLKCTSESNGLFPQVHDFWPLTLGFLTLILFFLMPFSPWIKASFYSICFFFYTKGLVRHIFCVLSPFRLRGFQLTNKTVIGKINVCQTLWLHVQSLLLWKWPNINEMQPLYPFEKPRRGDDYTHSQHF